jgi:hypothetical protein
VIYCLSKQCLWRKLDISHARQKDHGLWHMQGHLYRKPATQISRHTQTPSVPNKTGTPFRSVGSSTKPACSAGKPVRQIADTGFKRKLKAVHNKVSLGFVEGLNNKIRVIQRRAYGLRDEEYLRLKILTCMLPPL